MSKAITRYLTKNPCYKQGRIIDVKGLMLHSVACSQPEPMVFIHAWDDAAYWANCVHGVIGKDDVYITLPIMETPGKAMRGWHGGGSSNDTHIGTEMCEPAILKYNENGTAFTCSDREAAVQFVRTVTANAVDLFAELCVFHGLDPLGDGVIVSHAEGYRRGIACNHGDPEHLWRGLGIDYDMDKFRRDVAAAVAELTKEEEETVRYKFIEDVPLDEFRDVLNKLVRADILRGSGFEDGKRVIDLSHDMVRNIVFEYRGGAFDRKLIAMGLEPAVKE